MLLPTKFLPDRNELPNSRQEARKTLASLGMEYNAYHPCPNDCLLFIHKFQNDTIYSKCREQHYKNNMVGKNVRRKVLRHFLIRPQLCHLF